MKEKESKESRDRSKSKIILIMSIIILILILVVALIYFMTKTKKETREIEKGEETVAGEVEVEETLNENNTTVTTNTWDLKRVQIVYDTNETPVPVPVPIGYTASKVTGETKIDTGFVIYEGTEEVNDENKEEAQKTRNQWVWVPIYDVSQMYGTDSSGKLHGKLYSFSAEGRSKYNWTETEGVMKIISTSGSGSYREPDLLSDYDTDSKLQNYLTETNKNQLEKELTREFSRTIASIQKYGGFYIGRYETGGLSTEDAKVVRGDSDINSQTWYTMYRKCKMLKGTNENVATSMIWGSQWDATLKWIVDSGAKTYGQVSSTGWGNHSSTRRPTGYSESWKANNIYDLEGNMLDWTLEAYGTSYRVYRGSLYDSSVPASYRSYYGSPTLSSSNVRV